MEIWDQTVLITMVDQRQRQFAIAWLRHVNHWQVLVCSQHLDEKFRSHRIQKMVGKFRGVLVGVFKQFYYTVFFLISRNKHFFSLYIQVMGAFESPKYI